MKAGAMIELAQATGVRLEWLATGEGPMRADVPAVAGQMRAGDQLVAVAPPAPFRLFGNVSIDRLVDAYEGALTSTRGGDKRLTMHLTVVLYDQLSEAAETQENTAS
jgi:hypothetical protein